MRPEATETAWRGGLIAVTIERWGPFEREIVEHPGSVCVIAIDADDCVTLVRQPREAARRELLELPAGGLAPGEDPLAAARRELGEETGLGGGAWRELASFYTTPGFCRERMHVFVAEGVAPGVARPEPDERLEVVRWPLAEVGGRLGEIEDAKTLAGLLLYLNERRRLGSTSGDSPVSA